MNRCLSVLRYLVLGACCGVLAGSTFADCAKRTMTGTANASEIKVLAADHGGTVCQSCLNSAINTWNGSCSTSKNPDFTGSGSADFTTFVRFMGGANPGTFTGCSSSKCACAFVSFNTSGQVVGGTVRIWESAPGQNCNADATGILTHELAHLLGLSDPPSGCSCSNIMGSVNGSIDSQVCNSIDQNFLTENEIPQLPDEHPCRQPPV